jgi:hypothetical protein
MGDSWINRREEYARRGSNMFNELMPFSSADQVRDWRSVAPGMRSQVLDPTAGDAFARAGMNRGGLAASLAASNAASNLGGMSGAARMGALANIGRATAGAIGQSGDQAAAQGLDIRNQENARDFQGQMQQYSTEAGVYGQNAGARQQNALSRAGSYQDSLIQAQLQRDQENAAKKAALVGGLGRLAGGVIGSIGGPVGSAIGSHLAGSLFGGGGTPGVGDMGRSAVLGNPMTPVNDWDMPGYGAGFNTGVSPASPSSYPPPFTTPDYSTWMYDPRMGR